MAHATSQYLVPGRLDLGALDRAFAGKLELRPDGRSSSAAERSYYDTFDGRLHEQGLSLVYEKGRLALLGDDQRERAGSEWPRPKERMFAADLPAGALRDALLPLVEVRALTRIARVRGRRRTLRVLDGQGKTVARLVLDEPALAGTDAGGLRPRLHAVGLRGYDTELATVRRLLEAELGLEAVAMSLQDEAVARAGGTPGGVSPRPNVRLDPHERTERAAARILRRLLEVAELNLPGALADTDSEFLHDLRVAVRRSRSIQRELRRAFPPERLAHFRGEFRWLQTITGPSRDLDVYVLEFDGFRAALSKERRADLDPLRKLLVARRRSERRRMVRELRSPRTARLLADWAEFLDGLERESELDRPDAGRPIAEVAGRRIARVYKRMVKEGSAIVDSSPPEALHDLRKQSKELRYLLEFFAGLYPQKVIRPMVRTLKALQDTLGRFQDRQIQADLISSLGDDVRALDDGAAALMAMGQLVERLEKQQAEARSEFADRFAAFASARQRALVKETFS